MLFIIEHPDSLSIDAGLVAMTPEGMTSTEAAKIVDENFGRTSGDSESPMDDLAAALKKLGWEFPDYSSHSLSW